MIINVTIKDFDEVIRMTKTFIDREIENSEKKAKRKVKRKERLVRSMK